MRPGFIWYAGFSVERKAVTIEERFERIEHITAGLAEESRRDREENRQLWRDTQRQINDLGRKIAETNDTIIRLGDEMRAADRRLEERIDQMAERSEQADKRLGERIESLVSAMGEFLSKQKKGDAD
jgi:hypothetical protein